MENIKVSSEKDAELSEKIDEQTAVAMEVKKIIEKDLTTSEKENSRVVAQEEEEKKEIEQKNTVDHEPVVENPAGDKVAKVAATLDTQSKQQTEDAESVSETIKAVSEPPSSKNIESEGVQTSKSSIEKSTNEITANEMPVGPVETVKTDACSIETYENVMEKSSNSEVIDLEPLLSGKTSTEDVSIVDIPKVTTNSSAGLSLLSQYESENEDAVKLSDTESIVEVPVTTKTNDYRNQLIVVSSDSDSDSDAESISSASSTNDSDANALEKMRKVVDKAVREGEIDNDDDANDDDGDDDGENGKKSKNNKKEKRQPPKVKGELLLEDLPPIEDLHITVPENECIELGKIQSIVDQLVLVNALSNSTIVDLDTVLFLDKGKRVLGEVFDVLGQVADPLYCVRFNSNQQIHEKGIQIGDTVYVAPKTEYTQFVILSSLTNLHGSDASWENDIEPPPRYLDYSDDEEERASRGKNRNKERQIDHHDSNDKNDDESPKRPREQNAVRVELNPPASGNEQSNRRGGSYRARGRGRGRGRAGGRDLGHPSVADDGRSCTSEGHIRQPYENNYTYNNINSRNYHYQQQQQSPPYINGGLQTPTSYYVSPPSHITDGNFVPYSNFNTNSWHSNFYPMPSPSSYNRRMPLQPPYNLTMPPDYLTSVHNTPMMPMSNVGQQMARQYIPQSESYVINRYAGHSQQQQQQQQQQHEQQRNNRLHRHQPTTYQDRFWSEQSQPPPPPGV